MGASHHRLGNLIAMVDINALQADGPTVGVLRTEPVADKWAACGWHVQRVDGNDVDALLDAFDDDRSRLTSSSRQSSCATPGSAAAFRCWRTGRRRTSCASTPTNGRSAATSSPQDIKEYSHDVAPTKLKTSAMIASFADPGQKTTPGTVRARARAGGAGR